MMPKSVPPTLYNEWKCAGRDFLIGKCTDSSRKRDAAQNKILCGVLEFQIPRTSEFSENAPHDSLKHYYFAQKCFSPKKSAKFG